ncbi:MAG: hypothetical protein ABI572_05125 [Actinomycetota bacterium]
MPDALTSVIELVVGLGCLGAAAGLLRHPTLRILAGLLAAGGVAAAGHAVWALAAGR